MRNAPVEWKRLIQRFEICNFMVWSAYMKIDNEKEETHGA